MAQRKRILLDDEEIRAIACAILPQRLIDWLKFTGDNEYLRDIVESVAKAQAKKILIELQLIYNLPDEGMFHKKMGEFIKELNEEVSDNIC